MVLRDLKLCDVVIVASDPCMKSDLRFHLCYKKRIAPGGLEPTFKICQATIDAVSSVVHSRQHLFALTVCLCVAFHQAMQESFSLEVSQSPSKLLANQVPSAKEPFLPCLCDSWDW